MKTIINYFKNRQDKRLRTKLALKSGYGVNDLQAVYGFVTGGKSPSQLKPTFVDGISGMGVAVHGVIEVPELQTRQYPLDKL